MTRTRFGTGAHAAARVLRLFTSSGGPSVSVAAATGVERLSRLGR